MVNAYMIGCRSKLKAEDLKESAVGFLEAQWADDKDVKECQKCAKVFSYINRKVNVITTCIIE